MKKKELTQVKGLDIKELKQKANTLQKEIADLVLDKNMKKLKDGKSISKKKKELAQVLTVKRQKELLGQMEEKIIKTEEVKVKKGGSKEGKSQKSKVKSRSKN